MLTDPRRAIRNQAWETLATIVATEMVPRTYRDRPAAALAAIFYGQDLGLGPMQSLMDIDSIEGSPAPSARLQMALFRAAGHHLTRTVWRDATGTEGDIDAPGFTPWSVTLTGRRGDTGEALSVTHSVQHAIDAGRVTLTASGTVAAKSKSGRSLPWESYTEDLLWAGAARKLVRRLAPDSISGRR